ncbi:NHL repeat-containing protein [Lapillicoccus jejuensis]|uniref:DNA-binding beta-propeller fold protein YncE n=1 Tax=Lapillicoccus jejuensis TaxID=402171 RepID=A0A542E3U9_9MICO|nr:NHL repeat-containing protein [Lapillicoccus jejuensis]TQJ09997.1 DNA-binding beta-propeller fold protein YncE [Lapillicoccus jejuensis]
MTLPDRIPLPLDPATALSRRTLLRALGATGAVAAAGGLAPTAAHAAGTVRFDHLVLGPAYADMYPTDVVADATYWYVNDNGRYRLVAVNRATGRIDYEFAKARIPGTDDLGTGRGMGIDSAGLLYVADTINNRISVMTKQFVPVTSFGGRGTGPGRMTGITDVGVGPGLDDKGRPTEVVYVSDKAGHQNNTRLVKFRTDGTPIGTLGADLDLHYGQLVVDPVSHRLYVCDAIVQGFIIFAEDGTIIRKVGGRGDLPGQFKGLPRGIDVFRDRVYVTDSDNRRIQVFDLDGNFLFLFGKRGTGLGEFIGPKGLAVTQGSILVCDLYGYGLDEFDLRGNPIRSLFGGVPPIDGVNKPKGVDVDHQGRVMVIDWWRQAIVRCAPDGSGAVQVGQTGDRKTPGALTFPTDVRIQPGADVIFVANRESNDVEVLNPDGTSHRSAFFGNKELAHPVGIAFAPNGDLWVTDSPRKRVVRYVIDRDGHGTLVETDNGASIGGLRYCSGLDVAPDGTLWVTDGNAVSRRTASGRWTRFTQATGSARSFKGPWGVRVGPDGNVYVADSGNNRIVVMSPSGTMLAESAPTDRFGGLALYEPEGLAFGPDGTLFVADTNNDRVLALKVTV